jgi:hypothetical protein
MHFVTSVAGGHFPEYSRFWSVTWTSGVSVRSGSRPSWAEAFLGVGDVVNVIQRRWRLFTAIVLLSVIGVGLYLAFHSRPERPLRFRAISEVQIAEEKPDVVVEKKPGVTTTTRVAIDKRNGPEDLAMERSVRREALVRAGYRATDRTVGFSARLDDDEVYIYLVTTAPQPRKAERVATAWAASFAEARRDVGQRGTEREKKRVERDIRALRNRLVVVDYSLVVKARRLPLCPGEKRANVKPNSSSALPLNERAPVSQQLLAFERCALIEAIAADSERHAELAATNTLPNAFARFTGQSDATRLFPPEPSPVMPAGIGLLTGLLTALATVLVLDRIDRSIRSSDAAAHAFSAPVLGEIPAPAAPFAIPVAEAPDTVQGQAYRALAAMALTTNALPRALMVTTPHGDVCDEVAVNFAAALADFRTKTVVLTTSPDQAPYLSAFTAPQHGDGTLPELLERAERGDFDRDLASLLWSDPRLPGLYAVLPPPAGPSGLDLNSLSTLLWALEADGFDCCIIAGPALLEEADATIIAWTAGRVLWAVRRGEIKGTEARAAVSRVHLAHEVEPFGVVMVGGRSPAPVQRRREPREGEVTIDLRGDDAVAEHDAEVTAD